VAPDACLARARGYRSSDIEAHVAVSRGGLDHIDPFDARSGWTMPDLMLEPFERFRFAFGLDLDSSIGDVANPAVHSLANGRGLREEPEPDSLNAAADEVPSGEAHAGKARDYTAAAM
jgi:hypothetical protein